MMASDAPFPPKIYYGLSRSKRLDFDELRAARVDDWPRDREVCARRARVLRKRGEDIRFAHFTCNGKARYLWIAARPRWPKARPWSSAYAALSISWQNELKRRASHAARMRPHYQKFFDDMLGLAFKASSEQPGGSAC